MRPTRLHQAPIAVFALLTTLLGPGASAAVPTTTAIEGVLLSSGGGPAADGNYSVAVSIYGAETGGSAVWTESGVNIAAKGGQFSYQIGAKTPLSAAALNLSASWVGIQVGADPEMPRKPMGSAPFALRAALAEALECSGCLKAGHLDAGILQPYAKAADLSAYAKASDLAAYAKSADLSGYAKASDMADYVKASSLAKVAGTGSYNDLKDLPTLAKVAASGSYSDLTSQPKLPQLGAACGTNLVMKGIKADGSYECVSAGMAADQINEVSNDLIWNQFVDKTAGTADVQIKDGFSAGVTDTLNFPDVGQVQKIWVEFSASNSDVSKLSVELFAPGMGSPYVLYSGSKTGTALTAKFNDIDKISAGDIDKDWLNKNIKGNWSITVKDNAPISVPPGTPPFVYDGKFNWSIHIQTLSSKKIQIKGNMVVSGAGIGPAAALDVASTTQGFLPPRMSGGQRDAIVSPVAGLMIYNTDSKCIEFYNGAIWGSTCAGVQGSGGTVTDIPGFRIHTFTSSGSFTVSNGGNVDVLMVGGGGSGGGRHGGGGGGGGVIYMPNISVTNGSVYNFVIGAGGPTNSGHTNAKGASGGNTTAFGETALGGGGGGTYCSGAGLAGGSGGGEGHSGCTGPGGAATQGNPTLHAGNGYGNAGASNPSGGNEGSGGGGAGGAGQQAAGESYGGAGGPGKQINIDGNNYFWGGGGGGGGWEQTSGDGGVGGGGGGGVGYGSSSSIAGGGGGSAINSGKPGVKIGNPTTSGNPAGGAGGANTGGGGGGSGQADWNSMNGDGGAGGSGIVIVRYPH